MKIKEKEETNTYSASVNIAGKKHTVLLQEKVQCAAVLQCSKTQKLILPECFQQNIHKYYISLVEKDPKSTLWYDGMHTYLCIILLYCSVSNCFEQKK